MRTIRRYVPGAEWVPNNWNVEGQLNVFDQMSKNLADLQKAFIGDAEGARILIEQIYGQDLDEPDYIDTDVIEVFEENTLRKASQYLEDEISEDMVLYDFPQPYSATLEKYEQQLWQIIDDTWYATIDPLQSLLSKIEGSYGSSRDPRDANINLSHQTDELANSVDQLSTKFDQFISRINTLKNQWVKEVDRISTEEELTYATAQELDPEGELYAKRLNLLVKSIKSAISKSKSMPNNMYIDYVKRYLNRLKKFETKIKNDGKMQESDSLELRATIDEVSSIANTKVEEGIRSWDTNYVKTNDIVIRLQRSLRIFEQSSKKVIKSVPSYRFNIGQDVKVVSSNRTGKIIGLKRENGNGRQLYTVRVAGISVPKTYGVNELRKL